MSSFRVVLDACVLFPAALRDTLLRLAEARLYRVQWSDDILEEMSRNLVKTGRCTPAQAARLEDAMRRAFPEACVTGHQTLVKSLTNHPKDRHVLAAAIVGRAHVIVTNNLRDFPSTALAPFNVEAQSPDDFLIHMLAPNSGQVLDVLAAQAADLGDPPVSLDDLLDELATAAPRFVAAVRITLEARAREGS